MNKDFSLFKNVTNQSDGLAELRNNFSRQRIIPAVGKLITIENGDFRQYWQFLDPSLSDIPILLFKGMTMIYTDFYYIEKKITAQKYQLIGLR